MPNLGISTTFFLPQDGCLNNLSQLPSFLIKVLVATGGEKKKKVYSGKRVFGEYIFIYSTANGDVSKVIHCYQNRNQINFSMLQDILHTFQKGRYSAILWLTSHTNHTQTSTLHSLYLNMGGKGVCRVSSGQILATKGWSRRLRSCHCKQWHKETQCPSLTLLVLHQ